MPQPTPDLPAQMSRSGSPRWIAPVALVVSLLAAGAAGWALLKPAPEFVVNPAVADPKTQACSAFSVVSQGVAIQTRKNIGGAPADLEAVAANARLAMAGGAAYLRNNVPSNTPDDLAGPLLTFADQLQTIAQYYLAGESNNDAEQAARLVAVDETTKQLIELCG